MTTDWTSAFYTQERKVVKITSFNANTAQVRLSLFSPISAISNYVVITKSLFKAPVPEYAKDKLSP